MTRHPALSLIGQDLWISTFLDVTRKLQRKTLRRLWEIEIINLTFTQHAQEKI
jgi:hypothetical protein